MYLAIIEITFAIMCPKIEFPLPDGNIAAVDNMLDSTIIPARPGLFVIDLLPLPGGGFDPRKVLKTPMQAWQVGGGWSWGRPVVSGATVTDGWAVLFPDGFVAVDEYTALDFDGSIPLQTWIDSEIRWMKVAHRHFDREDMKQLSPPREEIFCYGAHRKGHSDDDVVAH